MAEFMLRGFSGARTAQIARRAKISVRMLYHYFGGKDALYVMVLEEVLAKLRHEELRLDFEHVEPLQACCSCSTSSTPILRSTPNCAACSPTKI